MRKESITVEVDAQFDEEIDKKGKKNLIKAVLLFLLLFLAMLLVFKWVVANDCVRPVENPAVVEKLQSVGGNKETGALSTKVNKAKDSDKLRCIVSSAPTFKNANAMGSWCFANHADNAGYVLQVVVTDDASGDVIYTSPDLKPNEKVQEDYISKKFLEKHKLVKGNYNVTATFKFYNAADKKLFNEIPFNIVMVIKE